MQLLTWALVLSVRVASRREVVGAASRREVLGIGHWALIIPFVSLVPLVPLVPPASLIGGGIMGNSDT